MTLFLDCGMGAAGDMLMAALYELLPEERKAEFLCKMNDLGLENVRVVAEKTEKCGVIGTHMAVFIDGQEEESHDHHHHHEHTHEHHHDHHHDHEHTHEHTHEHGHTHSHASMSHISHVIEHLDVSEAVKENARAVYGSIAEAEGKVHGKTVEEIHFHEVGTLDAVADVIGVCLLVDMLRPDQIIATPVCTGTGHVHCAHGILPVPAPATTEILKGVPVYGGSISGELCTPTGAALLKRFVTKYAQMPVMVPVATGYGMGKKDFPQANCVRAILGTTNDEDSVCLLETNLDDMTPEQIGFAVEALLEKGALDVYTIPIGMKKNRPAVMLCCLCRAVEENAFAGEIFRLTTTLGIRVTPVRRHTLTRAAYETETTLGKVRVKTATGYGVERKKAEYDDLAKLAKERGTTPAVVLDEIREQL